MANSSKTKKQLIEALQAAEKRISELEKKSTPKPSPELSFGENIELGRSFFDGTADPIAIIDLEDRIIDVNPAFEKLFGYKQDELIDRKFPGHFGIDDGKFDEWLNECKKKSGVSGYETIRRHKSGKDIHVSISVSPIKDSDGNLAALSFWYRDITERKSIEKEREQMLHNMAERNKELKCMYGVSESIRRHDSLEGIFNDVVSLIPSGWQYPEITRAKIIYNGQKYASEPFDETKWKLTGSLVADGRQVGKIEVYYIQERPERDDGPFLKEERNLLESIAGTLSQAIQNKRAEEEIRYSKDKFAKAFQTSHYAITITRARDGKFIDVNDAFTKISEYTREEALTNSSVGLELWNDRKDRDWVISTILGGGNVVDREFLFRKKSGETLLGLFSARIIIINNEPFVLSSINDITERKKAEEAIRESEEYLRTTLNSIGDAVITTDTEGNIVKINPVAESLTGWRAGEAAGKPIDDIFKIFNAKTGKKAQNPVGKVLKSGKVVGLANHTMLISKDGNRYQIADSAAPIRGSDNQIIGVVMVFRDVTEEYRIRKELRKSEERLKLALKGADLGLWDWNIQTGDVTFNERWAEMLGYALSEIKPHISSWENLTHPEDLPEVNEILKAHIEGKTPYYEAEFRMKAKDGSWVWILDRGKVLEWDEEGKPLRANGTHLDISKRKKAEEEIKLRQEFLATVLETSHDGFWVVNSEGRIEDVNRSYCQLTGYSKADLLGKHINEIDAVEDPEITKEKIKKLIEKGSDRFETKHRRKDGSIFDIDMSTAYIDINGGKFVCFGRDISERKRSENALRESEDKFRTMVDQTADMLLLHDLEGNILDVNQSSVDKYGYSREGLLKMKVSDLDPNYIEREEQGRFWDRLGINEPFLFEAQQKSKDGILFPVEVVITKIELQGQILIMGLCRDISERKEAEKALKASEEKYRMLFEKMVDGFAILEMIYDESGKATDYRYLELNPAHEYQTGLSTKKIIGKSGREILPNLEDAWINAYAHVDKTGEALMMEDYLDDLNSWFLISGYKISDGIIAITFENTTSRKLAEIALSESEVRYRSLFDNTLDAILIANDEGRYIDVNPAACKMLGYSEEELRNLSVWDITPEPDKEKGLEIWKDFISRGEMSGEYSLINRDGEIRQMEFHAVANVQPDMHVSVLHDITERKLAEESLRQSQELLSRAQEISHTGSWQLDFTTNRLSWSDEVFRIFGCKPQEFAATYEAFLDAVHPEDRAAVDEAYSLSQREGSNSYDVEHRIIRRDTGEVRYVHERCVHERDDSGALIKSTGMVHDITERKQSEQALRESERRLRESQKIGRIGHVEYNAETGGILWADMIYELYERDPALGPPAYDEVMKLHNPKDAKKLEKCVINALEHSTPYSIDVRANLPGGKEAIYHVIGNPVTNDAGKVIKITGTVQDITERKLADEALRKSEDLFQSMLNSIPDMVSVHDKDMNIKYSNWKGFAAVPKEIRKTGTKCYKTYRNNDSICPDCRAKEVLETGNTLQEEVQLSEDQWVDLRVIPIISPEGKHELFVEWVRDISDRKQNEDALRQSEERFKKLSNLTFEGIIIHDKGIVLDANESMTRLTGYSKEELIGQNIIQLCVEQEFHNTVLEKMAQSSTAQYEVMGRRKDGKLFPVELESREVETPGGILRVTAARDITQRKEAEDALRESEERYYTLIQNINDGLMQVDNDDKIEFVNESLCRMFGYSKDELIGRTGYKTLIFKDDRKIIKEKNKSRHKNTQDTYEVRGVKKSGEVISLNISGSAIKDAKGNIIGSVGLLRDITERKRNEKALRDSEAKFSAIIQSITEGIIYVDRKGKILHVNNSLSDITGIDESNLIGDNALKVAAKFLSPKILPWITKNVKNVLSGKGMEPFEIEFNNRILEISAHYDESKKNITGVIRDITDRRKSEEAIRESEERFRLLYKSAGAGIGYYKPDGEIISFNPIAAQHMGGQPEDFAGKNLNNIFPPEAASEYMDRIKKALESDEIQSYEDKVNLPIGVNWFLSRYSRIESSSGELLGIQIVSSDITEIKNAQEELKKRNDFIYTVMDNLPIGIALNDFDDGTANYINKKFEEIYGWPKEDLKDITSFFEKVYPEEGYRKKLVKQVMDDINSKDPTRMHWDNIIATAADGSKRIIDALNIPLFDQNTMVSTVLDVTEERMARKALKESEEKIREIFEHAPVGIVITRGRTIQFANMTLANMVGYEPEEMYGRETQFLYISENEFNRIGSKLFDELERKGHYETETQFLHKSGREIDVIIKSNLSRTSDLESDIISVIVDITARKKVQEDLQKINKLESLGILAGGIAHNFKNMLTSMSLSVELAKMKPERARHHMEKISKSIDQASALATKFQTFSKGGEPVLKPCKVNSIITDAAEMALSGSSSVIEYVLDDDIHNIMIDDKQMNEVFTNLLINADQAMPNGGEITIRSSIVYLSDKDIANLRRGTYIRVDISDNGMGIPESHLKEIFTPFFSTKQKGQGLGLASVFYIIEKHRGAITVESEVEKGTTFSIFLPALKPGKGEKASDEKIAGFESKIRILLLDDDTEIIEGIEEMAASLGLEITCMNKPYEAIEKFRASRLKEPFDLVVLDLTLKGESIDGHDVLKELKEIDENVKALVFSGHSAKPIVAKYEEYGFVGRLDKPFNLSQFVREIKRIMAEE